MGLDLYPAPAEGVIHGLDDSAVLWDEVDELEAAGRQAARADAETEAKTGIPTNDHLQMSLSRRARGPSRPQ